MARTRAQIKNIITTEFMDSDLLANTYGFVKGASFADEFSAVSVESLLFDAVSAAIFIMEQLFGQHKTEVTTAIREQKTGTARWYRTMALSFQYGFDLLPESDLFDNGTSTAAQIAASKVIKQAAVLEASDESRVIIKIAGEVGGFLSTVTNEQRDAFEAYMQSVKFAGTPLTIVNFLPDLLFLNITIFRNPLVLDAAGTNIVSGGKPVEAALLEFVKELPFNGEIIVAKLVDKLQSVDGVEIPHVNLIESSWIDAATNAYGEAQPISVRKVPESGYFTVVDFLNIDYVV